MELPKLMECRNGFVWCLICQVKTDSMATFETHKRMKQHIRSFTLQQRGNKSCYGCVACGLEFESPDLFEKHIRSIRHREKVYEKGPQHKLAARPKEKKDVIYRCNICKFDTKSSEEYELHQYSAVHKSKEQFLAQSFKRKGSVKTPEHAPSPSSTTTSAQIPIGSSTIAPSKTVPDISKELASFVEGFDEHFLETAVEMKAFLEPFYVPSNANKDGVKLCRKCGEVLRQPRIWTHIYDAHLRVHPFSCQQCGAKFCAEEDLSLHAQFTRHDHDAPGNKDNELRILRFIFESRRKGANAQFHQEAASVQDSSSKERPGNSQTLPIIGPSDTPFVETGLRNFLMSQFPSSPKCLEKYSSASDLRQIMRPYFAKFISTNAKMTLECTQCRLEATNFWEHVYMMHLKSLPFKCVDCSHRELTSHRIDRHCKSLSHQQERNFEIALLKSALESVWPVLRTNGSTSVASASPSSLSSNSSSSSGYSSISSRSGRTSVEVENFYSKRRSPERLTATTPVPPPPSIPASIPSPIPASIPSPIPEPTRTPAKSTPPPRSSAFQPSSFQALPVAAQPEEPNAPFISDDLRIFVISQLAPRTISDKEMKTRLEQHFHGFITKFIPLSESQSGGAEEKPASAKPMKFCTKCHKSFEAASLWLHIYEFHLLCKPYVCGDCPVARLSNDELTKHCAAKGHQPDVLSEFKILRKVFFGKEIKGPIAKVDTPAPVDVITLADSPLKPSLKPSPRHNPQTPVLSSPSTEMKSRRPRMGVYTPKKGDHVRVNGNVAITPIDAAATKTTTTTLTTSIAVTASTTISSATNGCRFEPQSTEKSRPQKKARKTMPSSRKEAECILLSPTNEELNRTVTPGKVRKRASMGGCAIPQKRKRMEFDDLQVADVNEDSSTVISDVTTAAVPGTLPKPTTTTTTPNTLVPRKKTARKMMKSKIEVAEDRLTNDNDLANGIAKETNTKVTIDGEEPTVSVELAVFLKTQSLSDNVTVKELKKVLKNYYLSAFMRSVVDEPGEVECTLCDSSFKKTLLLHHIYRHHLKVKPFSCLGCPKRQTWSANLEKHCEDNDHSPDVDSESRFIRQFFKHYGASPTSSGSWTSNDGAVNDVVSSEAADAAADAPTDAAAAEMSSGNAEGSGEAIRGKAKRKGRDKEFKLEDVPSNLRPSVDDDLLEYITSRKLPRSAMTLDEYRMRLDSHYFAGCLTNPDRQSSHSLSQAFIIECAKCDQFCSQSDYWTHIYGEHLHTAPFACHGCDVTSASYSTMEIHCLESNDCDGGVTKDTHRINSQELALLKYLFSKTACAAFADAQKPENEQGAVDANDTTVLVSVDAPPTRKVNRKKRLRGRADVANLNAITEQELAEMMSPQAMRNYMYEQNRRKAKDLKFLTCDHGCDYKTKDVAVYQHHIRRHNNQEAKFQCDIDGCSYNVNDKTQMTAHSKYHHKSKEEEHAIFANDHLDMLSLVPTESGLFECPHCEYVVHHRRSAFLSHLSRHSMLSSAGQFYCSFCGFSGDSAEDIDQHIRAHHKQLSNEVDGEEEVAGTSRSGTQRRIQKSKVANAKYAKSCSTKQPLDPEDPDYRKKLVSKYFLAPLSVSSLGLLTDEELEKRRRQHQAPIPTVSLKTAEWRNAFAAVSDADLETRVAGIMQETLGSDSTGAIQQPQHPPTKSKTRTPANANPRATAQSSTNSSALVKIWQRYTASTSSTRTLTPSTNVATRSSTMSSVAPNEAFSCCICPFIGQSPADLERHANQHTSLNDLAEELVIAEMNDGEGEDASDSKQEAAKEEEGSNFEGIASNDHGNAAVLTSGSAVVADKEASASRETSVENGARIEQMEVGGNEIMGIANEQTNCDTSETPAGVEPKTNGAATGTSPDLPSNQTSSQTPLKALSLRIKSAITEVTSFRCSFCCHSAKTPLVAQRHLQSHFKMTLPPPRLSCVVLNTDQVHGLRERIPGIAAGVMRRSIEKTTTKTTTTTTQNTASSTTETSTLSECDPKEQSSLPSSSLPTTFKDDLSIDKNLVKIQGGDSSLAHPNDLHKDIQKSIADFRSKLHETAGLAGQGGRGNVVVVGNAAAETTSGLATEDVDPKQFVDDDIKPSTSASTTREILESVKAQTVALANHHLQTSGVKSESSCEAEMKLEVKPETKGAVDCSVCDVALSLGQMLSHSALHSSAFDIDGAFDGINDDENDDRLECRLREKLNGLGEVEKRELGRLLQELEEEEEEKKSKSSVRMAGSRATCRFCCLEVESGKLLNHESRHLETTAN